MPHKCMNCGEIYEDGAEELIEGCDCGASLFLYGSDFPDDLDLDEEKEKVVSKVDRILHGAKEKAKEKMAVSFDLPSIKVPEEGVYEINVKRLIDEIPIIAELQEDGTYFLHLPSVLGRGKSETKKLSKRDLESMEESITQEG